MQKPLFQVMQRVSFSQNLIFMLQASDTGDDVDDEDDVSTPFPDLMDTMSCFEQGGVSSTSIVHTLLLFYTRLVSTKKRPTMFS